MEKSGKVLKFILSFFIFIRANELCSFLIMNFIVHRRNFNIVSCILCHIMQYVGPYLLTPWSRVLLEKLTSKP